MYVVVYFAALIGVGVTLLEAYILLSIKSIADNWSFRLEKRPSTFYWGQQTDRKQVFLH